MKRKHKKYARPKKAYDKPRILGENKLVSKYGLKNKKEIWKAEAKVKYFRNRAKSLITADSKTQNLFFDKLREIGLKVDSVADALALNKEDILKRRFSTIVANKGLADNPRQARQMIVHKRIKVDGKAMNIPSYLVKVSEEGSIEIKKKVKAARSAEVIPVAAEETSMGIEDVEMTEEEANGS